MLFVVYGDSLSLPRSVLRVRPEDTFPELVAGRLRDKGQPVLLYNRSLPGTPIGEMRRFIERDLWYFGTNSPSCCVIQLGIVDCAPRAVPAAAKRLVDRLPGRLRAAAVRGLWHLKPVLIQHDLYQRETEPEDFREHLRSIVASVRKLHERVCVINIAPHHPAIESRSPRLPESIVLYNRIIAESVAAIGSHGVGLVDVHAAMPRSDIDRLVNAEDGHHITVEGHRQYADALLRALGAEAS